mmetsp:Transcript_101715/g.270576  ORF Transcript_101715/g.270576 Transcript_101715/m.270576 type:complete len:396 (-) Transcript_101715:71-1258(-)
MQAPPHQELASLRTARAQFLKEKETLNDQLADWKAKITQKKEIIANLEQTVAELQKPEGRRTGLLRCAAEFGRVDATTEGAGAEAGEPAPGSRGTGPTSEELALGIRLAEAVAVGPSAELSFGWSREDFDKEFSVEEGSQMQQFFSKLSCEQRLVWEMQNPPEYSLRVDRQLLAELRKAGRRGDVELLITAAGPPGDREREYRPHLWLQHHPELDASYVEKTAQSTSLLTLACRAGFGGVARELLGRRADIQHVNKDNSTALLSACRRRSWDCARLLLEARADANETVGGSSLLVWAAGLLDVKKDQLAAGLPSQPSSEPLVPLLLEFAAEPNTADAKGRTALMHAAGKDKTKVCEALIAARADPSVKDGEGKTAVEVAIEHQHFGLADWLETLM